LRGKRWAEEVMGLRVEGGGAQAAQEPVAEEVAQRWARELAKRRV
jgi:hypothetical protein